MPRPALHASPADRQRAYRERQKSKQKAQARAEVPAGAVVLSAAEAAQIAHHLNVYATTYTRPPGQVVELLARLGSEFKPRPSGLVCDL